MCRVVALVARSHWGDWRSSSSHLHAPLPHPTSELGCQVADHALYFVLSLFRRGPWTSAASESGVIAHGAEGVAALAVGTRRLRGATIGLFGFGRIGMAAGLRAKALGMRVLFYDPGVPSGVEKGVAVPRRGLVACGMSSTLLPHGAGWR